MQATGEVPARCSSPSGRVWGTITSCCTSEEIPFELTAERVRLLCDRDFGIGSDGILVIGQRVARTASALVFNPDGSEAEMCGNGVRMVARKLKMEGSIEPATAWCSRPAAGDIVPVLGEGYTVRVTWASRASAARSSRTSPATPSTRR